MIFWAHQRLVEILGVCRSDILITSAVWISTKRQKFCVECHDCPYLSKYVSEAEYLSRIKRYGQSREITIGLNEKRGDCDQGT